MNIPQIKTRFRPLNDMLYMGYVPEHSGEQQEENI